MSREKHIAVGRWSTHLEVGGCSSCGSTMWRVVPIRIGDFTNRLCRECLTELERQLKELRAKP